MRIHSINTVQSNINLQKQRGSNEVRIPVLLYFTLLYFTLFHISMYHIQVFTIDMEMFFILMYIIHKIYKSVKQYESVCLVGQLSTIKIIYVQYKILVNNELSY